MEQIVGVKELLLAQAKARHTRLQKVGNVLEALELPEVRRADSGKRGRTSKPGARGCGVRPARSPAESGWQDRRAPRHLGDWPPDRQAPTWGPARGSQAGTHSPRPARAVPLPSPPPFCELVCFVRQKTHARRFEGLPAQIARTLPSMHALMLKPKGSLSLSALMAAATLFALTIAHVEVRPPTKESSMPSFSDLALAGAGC
jgi:hypothetical protein